MVRNVSRSSLLRALGLVVACPALLPATGCTDRDRVLAPIPPPSPSFVVPESTLVTLERAVENRVVMDYLTCFTDSLGDSEPGFYATFDVDDRIAWIEAGNPDPGTWTLERETRFLPHFLAFAPDAFYVVTLTPTGSDFAPDASTVVFHRSYRVFSVATPVEAGEAVLTLVRTGGTGAWKIRFWEDRRDTTGIRTWGTARLQSG